MTLAQLFSIFPGSHGEYQQESISQLCVDSRQVVPRSVYFALKGTHVDGHQFLPQACQQGAIALVVEDIDNVPPHFKGSVLKVPSTRDALGILSAHFYDYPSEKLCCIGVTGTNGKTSITYMLEHILNKNGWPTAVLGTINHHFLSTKWPAHLTTPDPVQLQSRIAEIVRLGAKGVAFEVSSHALVQKRVDWLSFDIGIFTNLTRDHLDYHHDMQTYFHAKERLFSTLLESSKKNRVFGVVNSDDEWGKKLRLGPRVEMLTYGQHAKDFCFKIQDVDILGSHFEMTSARHKVLGFIPIPGVHNVYNAIAAVAAASVLGVDVGDSIESLINFSGVPGRLERVDRGDRFGVFVDYAHTPDALENVLRTLRPLTQDLCVVFGCGGDRDKGKRPLMLQTALQNASYVVLTSDNPRTEDPHKIINDSLEGVAFDKNLLHIEVDRKKAIEWALNRAKINSVVLIAGKGHEDYQQIGLEKLPFSDQEVVRGFLQ